MLGLRLLCCGLLLCSMDSCHQHLSCDYSSGCVEIGGMNRHPPPTAMEQVKCCAVCPISPLNAAIS